MERIFEALEKNKNITNEVKQVIKEHVMLIIDTFPNVEIDNIITKLVFLIET